MTAHDPNLPCEQFCEQPIGPDGEAGGEDWKNCCPECREKLTFFCREVLPAIRRDGYYSPPGSSVDDEFGDMTRQAGFRATAGALLDGVLGEGAADALGYGARPGGAS